jgi:hypothetical protein
LHWLIFIELQRFAGSKEKWHEWLTEANLLEASFYVGIPSDMDAKQLFSAAAEISHKSTNQFLKDFGKFIAPHLVSQFSHHIDKKWDLLDFLEHTEEYIHREVRYQIPGSNPPNLRSSRPYKDKVLIRYNSSLKMCAFAEGIIEQAAELYNEKITISQPKCMLKGDPECEILVTRNISEVS